VIRQYTAWECVEHILRSREAHVWWTGTLSLSFPEVSSVLALIESESVKGGMGFKVGDSELFFPGELGGGPSMSFGCFHWPIHRPPFWACTASSILNSSGGGKIGSAATSMTSPTSCATSSPGSVTTRYLCAARKFNQLARFSCMSFMIGLISSPNPVVGALLASFATLDCSSTSIEGGCGDRGDGSGLVSAQL